MTIDKEIQSSIKSMIGNFNNNQCGTFFDIPIKTLNKETILEILRFTAYERERNRKFDEHTSSFLTELDEIRNR